MGIRKEMRRLKVRGALDQAVSTTSFFFNQSLLDFRTCPVRSQGILILECECIWDQPSTPTPRNAPGSRWGFQAWLTGYLPPATNQVLPAWPSRPLTLETTSSGLSLQPKVENVLLSLLEALSGPMKAIFKIQCVSPGIPCVMYSCVCIYIYLGLYIYMNTHACTHVHFIAKNIGWSYSCAQPVARFVKLRQWQRLPANNTIWKARCSPLELITHLLVGRAKTLLRALKQVTDQQLHPDSLALRRDTRQNHR